VDRLRLLVVEDEVLMREGLMRLIAEAGWEVVGTADTFDGAVAQAFDLRPDVALLDVRMPPTHTDEGLRAAEQIIEAAPEVGILVLSHYVEARYALRLLERRTKGVGYLLKQRVGELRILLEAIRRVAEGRAVVDPEVVTLLTTRRDSSAQLAELSERELQLLELMAQGRSNRGIEKELVLSPKTIESHTRSIFAKLGLPPVEDDHRRVLAVLSYLRARER
jgi:DNA-binding NarL/FixJ family response regulator